MGRVLDGNSDRVIKKWDVSGLAAAAAAAGTGSPDVAVGVKPLARLRGHVHFVNCLCLSDGDAFLYSGAGRRLIDFEFD